LTPLLDVNLLVAVAWPNHVHHRLAQGWLRSQLQKGWATCPLTQSGFIRVSANSRAIPEAKKPVEAWDFLGRITALSGHRFWEDRIDLSDSDSWGITHLTGYRQVTDAHLLAIAMDHGGCLATLDRAIATLPLPGKSAKQHVWVVLDEK